MQWESKYAESVDITFLANAGVLMEYRGTTILLDGVFSKRDNPFSPLPAGCWEQMLGREGMFRKVDHLLFTHRHPDHFSMDMTVRYLTENTVSSVCLPKDPAEPLQPRIAHREIPCMEIAASGKIFCYQATPHITVYGLPTVHLDEKYADVPHLCYLITFDETCVLFTADVDYRKESLSTLAQVPLRAVFMNPLFFHDVCSGRKHGLCAEEIVVYHIPFPQDDRFQTRRMAEKDLAKYQAQGTASALTEPFQTIRL